MRIAIVAPLSETVPPCGYGGTERVVSLLTEELVHRGHDVTLFACRGSQTTGQLVECWNGPLRLDQSVRDHVACSVSQFRLVYDHGMEIDLIHNHGSFVGFPFSRWSPVPFITTVHGRLDTREYRQVYSSFPEVPMVAISMSQRSSLLDVNWMETVHNGVDVKLFHFQPNAGSYLVFLGRMSPEKRPDRAIDIAREVGMQLVMAAKIDPADQEYFDQSIAPLIHENKKFVEFIGEVGDREKDQLLGGAYAYLFPIDWPEPFGLTVVEAMATGTPVIAYRGGATEELIEHGVTGFVCDTMQEMRDAVPLVRNLDRRECRQRVEECFSSKSMADGYEDVYGRLVR
ncbi:MAG: glycosyltransferase family 4 protein [Chloroflexota bacterium]|nr:glycosyltransferase family 4 protein [Chloroflexota bacterium]